MFNKKNNNQKSSKQTLKEIFNHLECRKRFLLLTLLFSTIGTGLFIFASIAFGNIANIYLIKAPILNSPAPVTEMPTITAFDKFLMGGYAIDDVRSFIVSLTILISCYLVFLASQIFQNLLMINISQKTSAKFRLEIYQKLQQMPISYFDSHPSGDLMSRMTNDIDNISQGLTQSLSQFIQAGLQIILSIVMMLILSSFITLITIVLFPLLVSMSFFFIKKAQPQFKIQQERLGDLNGYIEEMISGQRVTNLMNQEDKVISEFEKYNDSLVKSAVISQTLSGFMFSWFSFTTNMLLLIVTGIAAGFAYGNLIVGGIGGIDGTSINHISYSFMVTYPLLLRNLLNPVVQLLSTINVVQAAIAGAERVLEILKLTPLKDKPGAKELKDVKGHVEFKNVNFGYTKEKLNLIDANIEAKPGQVIAIVGPTGAGKTTIINLLTKFYRYNDGQILIDGNEINDITEKSWRDNISIVLQDTFLFNETIKENIRYGRLDATDDEIIEAAKVANADSFIRQLEHGYDTVLTADGKDLSQGQRQLLAIARAVISNSNILILDEATSSVDTRTELLIQNAMLKLMKGRTSFVIAHRLSTIKNADQILVINDGKIIEKGNHNSLLKIKNGFYANLYHSQFKKGVIEES